MMKLTKLALTFSMFLCGSMLYAQQANFKKAWLEKWNNSRDYLVAIAAAMPPESYDYKPTEREMSFEAQLIHIQGNMTWLGTAYFDMKATPLTQEKGNKLSKEELIASLKQGFNDVRKAVEDTPEKHFKEQVTFFAGNKSKFQILSLLHDHVTHHRGQLIVYLNMNNVKPPAYVGW
jgi:uncharacterized damage-inducible protein DinB